MKKFLSVALTIVMVMSLMAMPSFAYESEADGVIYSGLPTGIEGGETVGDITFTKTAKEGNATVTYDSDANAIWMQPMSAWSEAQININHAVNKETGGNVSYVVEFETGDDISDMRFDIAPNWTGISKKFYTPTVSMALNREFKLVFTYNTQTAQFTSYLNGTLVSLSPDVFVKDAAANVPLTAENGITGFSFRFLLSSPQENVKVAVKNISIIHDVPKTGYGTYFSGLGGVSGTAKVENGVIVCGQTNVITNKHVVNNGDGTWNYNLGTAEDWSSSQLFTSFPVNNTTKGVVYFKYNFKTAADKCPTTLNTYFNGVKVQVGSIAKNTAYEAVFKYNTQTGAGVFLLDGVSKGTYEFEPSAGISGCTLDFIPNGSLTLQNVEVGIAKIAGTEYGTMISGVADVKGSGNKFEKSNMDGASFTASYASTMTESSITKDGENLIYSDNNDEQFQGEITSKLGFAANSSFEKKGMIYYEYTFAFIGVPSSIYIDIIPASGSIEAGHKTCAFHGEITGENKKIVNNMGVGTGAFDYEGAKTHTLGIAYEISTGDWCVIFDGNVSKNIKFNTTVSGATISKIDAATGIAGVQLRYFGNYVDRNSSLILKDATVNFVPYDNEQTIGEIELDKEDGTASITITKDAFDSKIADNVKFMIASYTGNRLASINYEEIKLKAGVRTYTISIGDKNGGTEIKAFLWNEDYQPLKIK